MRFNSTYSAWFGIGFASFFLVRIVLLWVAKSRDTWLLWYKGLPARKWLGMWLLNKGATILHKTSAGVHAQRFQGRIWISPDVKGFKDETP